MHAEGPAGPGTIAGSAVHAEARIYIRPLVVRAPTILWAGAPTILWVALASNLSYQSIFPDLRWASHESVIRCRTFHTMYVT